MDRITKTVEVAPFFPNVRRTLYQFPGSLADVLARLGRSQLVVTPFSSLLWTVGYESVLELTADGPLLIVRPMDEKRLAEALMV